MISYQWRMRYDRQEVQTVYCGMAGFLYHGTRMGKYDPRRKDRR